MIMQSLLWNCQHTVCLPLRRCGVVLGKRLRALFCKAGTFIFGGSVVIWLLSYVGPHGINVNINQSFLHMVGSFFGMLVQPLGFGTWQAGATLVPGF